MAADTRMITSFPNYYAAMALISENNHWKLFNCWKKVSFIRLCTGAHFVTENTESIEKIPKEVRTYLDRLIL